MEKGDFCIPNYNNIGVYVNYDKLPRTLEMYTTAVDYLIKKKSNSKSPWLVIWSTSFWLDKHWLMDELIEYLINSFKGTQFSSVYFVESQDGDGWFQTNIGIYHIK